MRHLYLCPLRWADLDLLGHVNNVTYVDYLQEARVDMLHTHAPDRRADDLAEGLVVVSHRVTYLVPLTFRFAPVSVETWVIDIGEDTFTLGHEIFDEQDGVRTTYLRARSVLAPHDHATDQPRRVTPAERAALVRYLEPDDDSQVITWGRVPREEIGHQQVHVRFSDVDLHRHVNNVKAFEYFQEARLPLLSRLLEDLRDTAGPLQIVVAQTDVDYLAPILLRPEPYDAWSWVVRVGRTSITLESVILDPLDGDRELARARVTAVSWDPATGRAAAPPEAIRERLASVATG